MGLKMVNARGMDTGGLQQGGEQKCHWWEVQSQCVLGGLVTILLLPAEPGVCVSDLRQKGLRSTVFLAQFLLTFLYQKDVSSFVFIQHFQHYRLALLLSKPHSLSSH